MKHTLQKSIPRSGLGIVTWQPYWISIPRSGYGILEPGNRNGFQYRVAVMVF